MYRDDMRCPLKMSRPRAEWLCLGSVCAWWDLEANDCAVLLAAIGIARMSVIHEKMLRLSEKQGWPLGW